MPVLCVGGWPRGAIHHDLKAEPLTIYVRHCTECKQPMYSALWILVTVFRRYVTVPKGSYQVFSRPASNEHSIACA